MKCKVIKCRKKIKFPENEGYCEKCFRDLERIREINKKEEEKENELA